MLQQISTQNGGPSSVLCITLFPGLKRFPLFVHALNHGGIPQPPHTIDILLYARDAYIDMEHYNVCEFIIAAYGMQKNSLDCIHPAMNGKSELPWSG